MFLLLSQVYGARFLCKSAICTAKKRPFIQNSLKFYKYSKKSNFTLLERDFFLIVLLSYLIELFLIKVHMLNIYCFF